jgi:hypothetical protein
VTNAVQCGRPGPARGAPTVASGRTHAGLRDEELLRAIHASAVTAGLLARFDFDVEGIEHGPVEPVHLASGAVLTMVGRDGSGGAFMLVGPEADEQGVVYSGSEGEGGLVATTGGTRSRSSSASRRCTTSPPVPT